MRELFIYYRIPVANADTALAMVGSFQAALRARHTGLTARLLRRPDEPNGTQTWMEIYSFHGPDGTSGIDAALETEVAAAAAVLAPLIVGARHTEVFVPCAS